MYSTTTALDRIVQQGVNWFERKGASPECEAAIDEVVQAVEYAQSYSELADTLVTIWQYYHDQLFEQERENLGYHLIDPLLDVLQ